jgi:hypothetical protein
MILKNSVDVRGGSAHPCNDSAAVSVAQHYGHFPLDAATEITCMKCKRFKFGIEERGLGFVIGSG